MPHASSPTDSSSSRTRTILAIAPDGRDPSLLRVTIGPPRRRAGLLHPRDAEPLGLAVGMAWTPSLQAAFDEAALMTAARRRAHRWLGKRPLSTAALLERLRKAGYAESLARRLARDLELTGLIDDAAYAKSLVEHERSRRPIGERLLRDKLASRGIAANAAEDALRRPADEHASPLDDALALARATLAKMNASLDAPAKARRLFGVLARRGFEEHVAEEAVRTLLGAELRE